MGFRVVERGASTEIPRFVRERSVKLRETDQEENATRVPQSRRV